MFENKKKKLTIFLTGDFHLEKDEVSTIILEFGDMGIIQNVKIEGVEREFIESRDLYIKEVSHENHWEDAKRKIGTIKEGFWKSNKSYH